MALTLAKQVMHNKPQQIKNKTKPNHDFCHGWYLQNFADLLQALICSLDCLHLLSVASHDYFGLWFKAVIQKPSLTLTTVIGCKGLIIVRRRILLASEQAPLLSPLRTLSLTKINNRKPKINASSL